MLEKNPLEVHGGSMISNNRGSVRLCRDSCVIVVSTVVFVSRTQADVDRGVDTRANTI